MLVEPAGIEPASANPPHRVLHTKLRMNQASVQFNLGYTVYQQKGQWFVSYRGATRQFDQDEIILERG